MKDKSNKIEKKLEKKLKKEAKKEVKSWHPLTFILVVLCFVVAGVGSYFGLNFLQKNDKFELLGQSEVRISLNEAYEEPVLDEAVVLTSFGQSKTSEVFIDQAKTTFVQDVSNKTPGVYYIVYTTKEFKFNDVIRVRTIIVE